jgi:hypothetical protein
MQLAGIALQTPGSIFPLHEEFGLKPTWSTGVLGLSLDRFLHGLYVTLEVETS